MISEEKIKVGFGKVKEDIEGVKDELAFVLKRIAKLESGLIDKEIKLKKIKSKKGK